MIKVLGVPILTSTFGMIAPFADELCYCPLLVLKGICHYCKYVLIFSKGLKQMEVISLATFQQVVQIDELFCFVGQVAGHRAGLDGAGPQHTYHRGEAEHDPRGRSKKGAR